MIIEDLQHIFKTQLEQIGISDAKLFYMLTDGEHAMIDRHRADDLAGLVPLLSAFEYAGSEGNIPRFTK